MTRQHETTPRRAVLLVIDSLGLGSLPDAAQYDDAGADTFGHIAEACAAGRADQGRSGPLAIPNLQRLGLVHAAAAARAAWPAGLSAAVTPAAAWGFAAERWRASHDVPRPRHERQRRRGQAHPAAGGRAGSPRRAAGP